MEIIKVVCSNEEELKNWKHKAMMAKVITLEEMGRHPIENPSGFSRKDKRKALEMMDSILKTYDEDRLTKEFNEIVCERMLEGKDDISKYPIYEK